MVTHNPDLQFDAFVATDAGRRYTKNQDAVLLQSDVWSTRDGRRALGLAAVLVGVADGAAFAPCASRASRAALQLLAEEVLEDGRLLGASVARRLQQRMTIKVLGTRCEGMSTTLAAIHLNGRSVRLLSVGDSRIYRWRGGSLKQMSIDHSLHQRMVNSGEIGFAPTGGLASIYDDVDSLLVASDYETEFDVFSVEETVCPGDLWICCSDGATVAVDHEHLSELCHRVGNQPQELVESVLVQSKATIGNDDNISVAAVRAY